MHETHSGSIVIHTPVLGNKELKIISPGGYKCRECPNSFTTAYYLQKHLIELHTPREENLGKVICRICGKRFLYPKLLQQHVAITHERKRQHVCQHCGKQYMRRTGLRRHWISYHPEEVPQCKVVKWLKDGCEVCGKKLTTELGYKQHMKRHSGIRNYCCAECGETFVMKEHLRNHERRHTQDFIFKCPICGVRYTNEGTLHNHLYRYQIHGKLYKKYKRNELVCMDEESVNYAQIREQKKKLAMASKVKLKLKSKKDEQVSKWIKKAKSLVKTETKGKPVASVVQMNFGSNLNGGTDKIAVFCGPFDNIPTVEAIPGPTETVSVDETPHTSTLQENHPKKVQTERYGSSFGENQIAVEALINVCPTESTSEKNSESQHVDTFHKSFSNFIKLTDFNRQNKADKTTVQDEADEKTVFMKYPGKVNLEAGSELGELDNESVKGNESQAGWSTVLQSTESGMIEILPVEQTMADEVDEVEQVGQGQDSAEIHLAAANTDTNMGSLHSIHSEVLAIPQIAENNTEVNEAAKTSGTGQTGTETMTSTGASSNEVIDPVVAGECGSSFAGSVDVGGDDAVAHNVKTRSPPVQYYLQVGNHLIQVSKHFTPIP